MTITEQALKLRCPKCRAQPDEQCVHLHAKQHYGPGDWRTYKPHAERYALARAKAKGTTPSAERRRAARAAALRKHAENLDVARSLAQFDTTERERLKVWLQQHGSILWS